MIIVVKDGNLLYHSGSTFELDDDDDDEAQESKVLALVTSEFNAFWTEISRVPKTRLQVVDITVFLLMLQ